ncbi:MAG TPA: Crp/Fnr family transcriptional regulator [Kofleriaceae bacterium]|nr:Crp/Fnr family transcriptional regulator [Kofleriaceae bacterium]
MARRATIDRGRLTQVALFQGLDDRTLDAVLAGSRTMFVEPRHVLTSSGTRVVAVLVVLQGIVQIATVTETGERSILGVQGPGALIGDAAVLDQDGFAIEAGASAVTVTALEDCLYLAIDARVFRHLVDTDVQFAANVARGLARRLRMMIVRDAWLTTLELPIRLARFITWLADREGMHEEAQGEVALAVRLSQESLGDMVGATRESINKHLRDWSRLGIVEHVAGKLRILDLARLRAIAAQAIEMLPPNAAAGRA